MVEVVTAALEDQLIDPHSFRLTKTASYITKRRSSPKPQNPINSSQ